MEAHSIDEVLVKAMTDQPVPPPVPEVANPDSEDGASGAHGAHGATEVAPEAESPYPEPEADSDVLRGTKSDDSVPEEKAESSPIDEYGNPVAKPKMYSEEEVQNMIRDRLSRGRHAEQPQPTKQEVKQASEDFKADPNSDESWEVQLESFIERTIEKRQSRHVQEEWQRAEQQRQADFEAKFTSGMGRYQDFREVVSTKPITNEMMLATRALDNPAAFVYAASKLHPQELDRISRISDPYAVSAEIGRLHERMVKEKRALSQAPKPLEPAKGDMPAGQPRQPSLEDRIREYAQSKRK
jgi:hypothetical protein